MSEIKKHWFKHDFYTCNDHKMQKLDFKYPIIGYGIFFKVVEILYQNDGKIVLSVLSDFDLFVIQDDFIFNKRVTRSILEITEKSQKARASANKRYGN
mgnify:CR=1 FL=1